MNKNKIYFCFIFSFFTLLNLAWSADFHSARVDGLGGAGHAAPLLTESIYMNPSYTSFMKTKAVSTSFVLYGGETIPKSYQPGSQSQEINTHMWNASLMDGSPDALFQAGVGYTQRQDGRFVNFGASKDIIEGTGVGVGGKLVIPNSGSNLPRVTDASVSGSIVITEWLQTAVVIDNVIENGKKRGMYRDFILGTKWNIKSLVLVYADPIYTPTYTDTAKQLGYSLGVEIPFFQDLYGRVGRFANNSIPYQAEKGSGFSLGVGWMGPRLTLDYAFSKVLFPTNSSSHNFGMNIFF